MADVTSKVQSIIDNNKVAVFSKSWCPYCRQTKATLDSLNVDYTLLELDKEEDGADIQAALLELTGQRSVPNTFIGKKHVGGNDNLQDLLRQGKLEAMLKDADAVKA